MSDERDDRIGILVPSADARKGLWNIGFDAHGQVVNVEKVRPGVDFIVVDKTDPRVGDQGR
jgi:hypothetical protein